MPTLRARARRWLALAIILTAILPAVPARGTVAAEGTPRYFPETGHSVGGRFREFWEARGGLFVFGLPLTAQFSFPSTDGRTYQVQYFERAVFELHPQNAPPYDVLLTHVGRERAAGRAGEVSFRPAARSADPLQTYFAETGHNVGPVFLDYWNRHGGLQNFGLPLSEALIERNAADGRPYEVQYFERARFEYHPENAGTPYVVLLGQLGLERMERAGVPASARAPGGVPAASLPAVPRRVIVTHRHSAAGYPFLAALHADLGIQAHWYGQPTETLIGMVRDIGFGWTKQQVVWGDIEVSKGRYEWGQLDAIVAELHAAEIAILLSVTKAPAWATPVGDNGTPRDPQDFADFMRALTARYRGKVSAYQLWNEPNLAGEVGGRIDAGHYAEMVKAGYLATKGVDPNCVVVLGGLASTGINDPAVAIEDTVYLEDLYRYRDGMIRDYFDALASHPYGLTNPPDTLWSEGRPGPQDKYYDHDSFYFRRFESHRLTMLKYGDEHKQIWLTEWGYGSDFRPDGHPAFNTIPEDLRARYVVEAIELLRARHPYVGATFLWNLNWSVLAPAHHDPAIYAIINRDYSPRPVYYALKALPK